MNRSVNFTKEKLSKSWGFHWDYMDVLIGGKSSIDLPKLRCSDFADATRFLCNYGFNPDNDKDQRRMHATFLEAIAFIERYLIPFEGEGGKMPPKEILEYDDLRKLILLASSRDKSKRRDRAWACAVLRVMHTIAHIEGVHRHVVMEMASDQIQEKFRKHIFRDDAGNLWLGEKDYGVELESFDIKRAKTRDSILLKLLHKPGNVAETIFDLVGVRIVTKRISDCLRVIKFLRQYHMVSMPNTNPSRARNNLLNIEKFRNSLAKLKDRLARSDIGTTEFPVLLEKSSRAAAEGKAKAANPHSSNNYRSIQLTCRQLIRCPNPDFAWVRVIQDFVREAQEADPRKRHLSEFLKFVESWPEYQTAQEWLTFFPFEIQVLDKESFRANQQGSASHDRYKKAQIRTAKRRVLRQVLQEI